MRTMGVAIALLVAGCGAPTGEDVASSGEAVTSISAPNTVEATQAFVDAFVLDGQPANLRQTYPANGSHVLPDDYWQYVQAIDAVLDAVQASDGKDFAAHARTLLSGWDARYWNGSAYVAPDRWFDDANWTALAMLHADDALPANGAYRSRAESIFHFIQEEGTADGAFDHGIWETTDAGSNYKLKAAVSNFGPVITAVKLGHVSEAKDMYGWARAHLADFSQASPGRVYDHVNDAGALPEGDSSARAEWTYNYGVAIGASFNLFRATGSAEYLDDAYAFADYLVTNVVVSWNGHRVLADGIAESCESGATRDDCGSPTFKGIAYRYLSNFYAFVESTSDAEAASHAATLDAVRDVLESSAAALWESRDSDTLFPASWTSASWSHDTSRFSSIGAEASAVMTLNLARLHGL